MRDEQLAAEAVAELTRLEKEWDTETAHIKADSVLTELLRKLGYDDVAEAFDNVGKWYA